MIVAGASLLHYRVVEKIGERGQYPLIRIAEAAIAFGGTWTEDGTIIYAASLGSGLLQIPAAGGTPTSLTNPDGAAKGYAHIFPQVLRERRRVGPPAGDTGCAGASPGANRFSPAERVESRRGIPLRLIEGRKFSEKTRQEPGENR